MTEGCFGALEYESGLASVDVGTLLGSGASLVSGVELSEELNEDSLLVGVVGVLALPPAGHGLGSDEAITPFFDSGFGSLAGFDPKLFPGPLPVDDPPSDLRFDLRFFLSLLSLSELSPPLSLSPLPSRLGTGLKAGTVLTTFLFCCKKGFF